MNSARLSATEASNTAAVVSAATTRMDKAR